MNSNGTFPSEDMARDAMRVWTLAKSIGIALLLPREGLSDELDKQTRDLQGGSSPAAATGRASDVLITRPLRARFQDNSSNIWFILSRESRMSGWLQADAFRPMLVTFSNGTGGDHIVFEGTAQISASRAILKEIWDSHADIHFPKGADDPSALLMQFEPRIAHFWTGGQDLLSFAVHYVAAKLTGEPQRVGIKGAVTPVLHGAAGSPS